jgi:hypothetical protein
VEPVRESADDSSYATCATCQLVELNDDSDLSTIVVKSRDSLSCASKTSCIIKRT